MNELRGERSAFGRQLESGGRGKGVPRGTQGYAPAVNLLTLFGLFAVSSMLVCYAFEKRSVWFILGFSITCALGSVYGFLQGAWPFGLVEGIWSVVALQRWWRSRPSAARDSR
jgi:hypothetical protein